MCTCYEQKITNSLLSFDFLSLLLVHDVCSIFSMWTLLPFLLFFSETFFDLNCFRPYTHTLTHTHTHIHSLTHSVTHKHALMIQGKINKCCLCSQTNTLTLSISHITLIKAHAQKYGHTYYIHAHTHAHTRTRAKHRQSH